MRFGLGFRLPDRHQEWVRHDLLDAGWRTRMLVRHVLVFAPPCAVIGLIPGQWWLRALVAAIVFGGSLCTVAVYMDEIRQSRLRQHRLPVPERPRGGGGPDGPPGPAPPDDTSSPWKGPKKPRE